MGLGFAIRGESGFGGLGFRVVGFGFGGLRLIAVWGVPGVWGFGQGFGSLQGLGQIQGRARSFRV